jgi:hypothetical protein
MEGEEIIAIRDRPANFIEVLKLQDHACVLPLHTNIISLYSSSQEVSPYHFLIFIQFQAGKVEFI